MRFLMLFIGVATLVASMAVHTFNGATIVGLALVWFAIVRILYRASHSPSRRTRE
jgi:membrane-bound ClpP family serine protease